LWIYGTLYKLKLKLKHFAGACKLHSQGPCQSRHQYEDVTNT
jgi:hypothetical protein